MFCYEGEQRDAMETGRSWGSQKDCVFYFSFLDESQYSTFLR